MADKISANVPAAALKQVKEANRLIAELNAPPGQQPIPRNSAFQPAAPAAPAASATPVAAPAPAPDPLKELEHKFSVLQGKYNAETSRMMGVAQALQSENAALLQRLSQQPAPAAPAPRAEDQFNTSVVTAKEREEYGEELVNLMARIAKANSQGEVTQLRQELSRMQGAVAETQQIGVAARANQVWTMLDAQVPNWRTINVSQQFVDWLENVDIMSGVARKIGLTNAFSAGNGPRVVGIFKRFLEEDSHTGPTPRSAAPVDQGTLVAPDSPRGGGGDAPNGQSGKIWSEQEIDEFYSRVQRKRIPADEAKAIEADILAALRDGRIVPRRDDRHIANSR